MGEYMGSSERSATSGGQPYCGAHPVKLDQDHH